jgi:sulfite reductase (NADPH) flavoprotein alpha-component
VAQRVLDTEVTEVRTVCSYCGVGCGIVLDVAVDGEGRRRVMRSTGDKAHPANRGRLCTKGATTADMLSAPGRLSTALHRTDRDGEALAVDVNEAITLTAQRLRAIIDEHGPDSVALYVSGQMSLEAQYLANKLAKGFIGTNQIESNSRLCMASAASGYKLSLGADGPPGSYDDLDTADVFFVIGANMADCHPILFLRMLDRMKAAGSKLIVVDPRRTATADKADLFLQIRPGTDLALLNGLLNLLVLDGRIDAEFIATSTDGWDAMPAFLADYTLEHVSTITGISTHDIRTAADWIGAADNWMSLWTMGLNQSTHGTWNTNALCNLHLATGAICRPGSGPFSLTGQPNAMGGREMGYMGPGLPGQRSVAVEADRAFVEHIWGVPKGTLRPDSGAGTIDLFSRMAAGEIKACWIICTNPVASVANRRTVIAGLEAAELVITQDVFADTETNAYADIVLPAAMWAESDGVLVNSERTLTRALPAADPPGQAMPDWQLIAAVAREMGYVKEFSYNSAEEIFDEIRQFWNPKTGYDLRGVTYARLAQGPVQWPSAPGDATGRNPIRYLNDGGSKSVRTEDDGTVPRVAFPTESGRAVFFRRPHLVPAEMPDDRYSFVLNTGRLPHQWHTLTKTGKVRALNRLDDGPFVELHPTDAEMLSVQSGDLVEVASRRGRAVLPARLSDRVQQGNCFAPFHWNDLFGEYLSINAVTSDAVDPVSFQPEFKFCAVSLTRVAISPRSVDASPFDDAMQAAMSTAQTESVVFSGLAAMIGVDAAAPPTFTHDEQTYLRGFLAALESSAANGFAVAPTLPTSSPLDRSRALWFDGALAAVTSQLVREDAPTSARKVVILWASQTGTAEEFASMVADRLAKEGARVTLRCMSDHAAQPIAAHVDLLVITSTFGDGESPDNGSGFWHSLVGANTPRCDDVRYAVLAFGDSSYSDFCGYGRKLDDRLEELGARRLVARVDCDAHVQLPANQWLDRVVEALATDPADSAELLVATPVRTVVPQQVMRTGAVTGSARVVGNRLLSGPGSAKEVRLLTFDTSESGLEHEVGDVVAIMGINADALVQEWLDLTGTNGEETVELAGIGCVPFRAALKSHLEIALPNAEFLRFVADYSDDRNVRLILEPTRRAQLDKWLWGRQTVDVLSEHDFRRERISAQVWTDVLRPLQARRYSIASSREHDPGLLRVLLSVVRFENPQGRQRAGVCSGYLTGLATDTDVELTIHPGRSFQTPRDPTIPMIMIGPGTGLAPFLGFLDKRKITGATGNNWLFFGEQREATDFYFRDELTGMHRDGLLTHLDVAFSRDQRAKIYVQDRMRDRGAELWSWLEAGAHVYVCGDANRMAKDVDQTLSEIVAAHGGMTPDDAKGYLRRLGVDQRYVRDVY